MIVVQLCVIGAAVDSADKMGCTALHIAALYGHELLSGTLLNYGADASKPGFKGLVEINFKTIMFWLLIVCGGDLRYLIEFLN